MSKKLFTTSEGANPNYLTKIVKINNLTPIIVNVETGEEASSVQKTVINGATIVVGKNTEIGDLVLYFACESAIDENFLSKNNLYEKSEKEKNSDPTKFGFFNKRGRVRATRFLGENSRGFCIPLSSLTNWLPSIKINITDELDGIEFNYVDGNEISKKYVPPMNDRSSQKKLSQSEKRDKHLKKFDKLVDNQFHFHIDTTFFERNGHKINPNDVYSISAKWHGTSGIVGSILTNIENEKIGWKNKLAKWLGADVIDKIYDVIYASRGVVKNRYVNNGVTGGFYGTDVWAYAKDVLTPYLTKGMTLYFEIVGYVPGTTKWIQKNHDYGCKEGECKIRIYRITSTNVDGEVFEFTPIQVQEWCKSVGLEPVKEVYRGRLRDLYPDIDVSEHWFENFLLRIKNDVNFHMEKRDPDCVNKVPFEGLVFRKESLNLKVYKLKTEAHYQMETKELDSGEVDIETAEAGDSEDN